MSPSAHDASGAGADGAREPIVPFPPIVRVVIDDLAFFEGDAIARPVSAELQATTPLLRRLDLAAGPSLERQLRLAEPLAVGAAVVSGAGDLRVELLVHAVVMSREERVTRDGVRRATLAALQRAADFEIAHLALAPFGLGAGNLDPEESAAAMHDAVVVHARRARWPQRLTFVVENEEERRAFTAALPREEP